MSQVDDRSKQAIDNLNNKVDQKRLAWENRFLRWLCIAFAVALVLTLIFNPSDTVPTNETDASVLRDYSNSVGERGASEPFVRPISNVVYQRTAGPTWTF
ncbi:hypothetical protein D3C85_621380 [compost metagenome]